VSASRFAEEIESVTAPRVSSPDGCLNIKLERTNMKPGRGLLLAVWIAPPFGIANCAFAQETVGETVILTCPPAISIVAYDTDLPVGWHSMPPKPPSISIYRSNEVGREGIQGGKPGETMTCRYGDGHLFIQSYAPNGTSCTAGQPAKNQFRCVGNRGAAR
jgi:hypothetical protein